VAVTLVEPREQRLLRNIERLMKRDIEIARLPTVADLRARRFELLDASLREVLLGEDLDRYRAVIEPLEEEYDILDIALAAASLAAEATGPDPDEEELPDMTLRPQDRLANLRPPRGPRGQRSFRDGMTRLYIGGGREIGLRPADIVGAIANESGLSGKAIGAIEIADHFALVEVPEEAADDVIRALNDASIRGRRLPVRRERDTAD
jgi:ATP-dependent RNA helicase DeaD